MAKVRLVLEWDLPDAEARPWVTHINNCWDKPNTKQSATAVINSVVNVPAGYQPEMALSIAAYSRRDSMPDPFEASVKGVLQS